MPTTENQLLAISYLAAQTGGRATYVATGAGYAAYATPTDMLCITGSASKIVRIEGLVTKIQTTSAALQTVYWIKRSTANTGGTPTTITPIAMDSTSPAATATATLYGAAPTTGSVVGNVSISFVTSGVLTGPPGLVNPYTYIVNGNLIQRYQPITLRGVNESICMNYNGAALTAGFAMGYDIIWTESDT